MKFDLKAAAKEHLIIVAHRGVSGGNIPCNTMTAYEIALKQGADMLEVDVDCSIDGKLFLFHPMMERAHINRPVILSLLPYSAVKKFRYVNQDNARTPYGVCDFDEFLETFNDRCFINIDKFWQNPRKIYDAIVRHGMLDQVLVKSKPSPKVYSWLEEAAPELAYMPIVRNRHDSHEELKRRNINYVGAEILFETETQPIIDPRFIETLRNEGILLWGNTIVYSMHDCISAGHNDDTAFTVSEDYGWGWVADLGLDIIQTDWPMMLIDYLKRTGRYSRQ